VSQYQYEQYWSNQAQLAVKKDIAKLLNDQALLLLTGSGLSSNFGYPSWIKVLDDLNAEIGNSVNKNDPKCQTNGNLDFLKYAQEIESKYREDPSKKNDIANFIFEWFSEDIFKITSEFYESLLVLGFQGFATLNYDTSLERLIKRYNLEEQSVNSINVCNEDCSIQVKNFLNNLTEKKATFQNVLHIHGVYSNPKSIILTQSSYDKFYNNGSIDEFQRLTQEITEKIREKRDPDLDGLLSKLLAHIRLMFDSKSLNSRHKKLIWLIFARYRILFVGFSADDSYFMSLLDVVKDDFTLPSKPLHYLLVKYTPAKLDEGNDIQSEEEREKLDKEKICEQLVKKGVWPIFYPVTDNDYQAGLERVTGEIESLKNLVKKPDCPQIPTLMKPKSTHEIMDRKISDVTNELLERK